MKTLRIHGRSDIRADEVPTPVPGEGQVLVRLQYAGICGSDLHYYFDGANGEFVVTEPMAPGHEVAGVVAEDPAGNWAPGTPVTIHPATYGEPQRGIEDRPYLWPGGSYFGSASTHPHTQGGMSEFYAVDASMLRALPAGMPTLVAALAEPLAIGLHALTLSPDVAGQRVLISGAGPIGLLLAAACVLRGAERVAVSDVLPGPLDRARRLGAHETIQVGEQEVPAGAYDLVLECSGVPVAVGTALRAARRAGHVTQVGTLPDREIPVNLASLVSKEVTYTGVFRFDDEIDEAIELLAAHPEIAEVVTTHVVPADRVAEAFDLARDSQSSGKVVVSLWND